MANDWILDVLADLRRFACQNDLGALARELDRASRVAAGELAMQGGGQGWRTDGNGVEHRTHAGAVALRVVS